MDLTVVSSASDGIKKICECHRLVDPLLTKQLDRPQSSAAGLSNNCARLEMTARLLTANPQQTFDHMCYRHLRMLGTHWGLQTGSVKATELKRRFLVLWGARFDLNALRVDDATFEWF